MRFRGQLKKKSSDNDCKARLNEGDVVWDVGCGTGGLTVEAAVQVGAKGRVYALDEDPAAVQLTVSNVGNSASKANVNDSVGKAPQDLMPLPNPDVVLVGAAEPRCFHSAGSAAKLKPMSNCH